MKRIHLSSLILGVLIGLGAIGLFQLPLLHAAEETKPGITQEDLDKKYDEVLDMQKELAKRLDDVETQTQFIKAASGK